MFIKFTDFMQRETLSYVDKNTNTHKSSHCLQKEVSRWCHMDRACVDFHLLLLARIDQAELGWMVRI